MNPHLATRLSWAGIVAAGSTLAGCASVAVTNDALQQRTAVSLSLAPGSFTITNWQNSGVQTNYNVTTQDGREFACYVTGEVSISGRNVSDAICRAAPKAPAAGAAPSTSTPAAKPAGPATPFYKPQAAANLVTASASYSRPAQRAPPGAPFRWLMP